jgi:DNA-binding response OmpR family regulator
MKKILILDSEDRYLNQYKKNLQEYELIIVKNVSSFCLNMKNLVPDLCIIDLNFDNKIGAGYHLIKAIREKFCKELPIIVASAMNNKKDIVKAIDLGANDFIRKPLDDMELRKRVIIQLDPKSTEELPLFSISEAHSACNIKINGRIEGVRETGVILSMSNLVAKNTGGVLQTPALHEIIGIDHIKGIVSSVNYNMELKRYFCNFDYIDPSKLLLDRTRSFLFKKMLKNS